MSSNPVKKDFSRNQIKILKLLFEKEYLQNELQKALNTTAPNLHYHLARLEGYNLIQKETLHKVGNVKINKISLNPSTREYVRKLLGLKNVKSSLKNSSLKFNNGVKALAKVFRKIKENYYRISIIILVLSLTGIIVSSALFFFFPLKNDYNVLETQELTANADIFTQETQPQEAQNEIVELTANADIFTQKTKSSDITVYDYSDPVPWLRLGLWSQTYDLGGYLSEIYVRFNLPKIDRISSMVLQLTYGWTYPTEPDYYYEVNASLVSNDWVEETTVWTERPDYLGTSTLEYFHNPDLESEVYLNLTNLAEGISDTLITIHLCPHNLSRIRFPACMESSESYGITPKLILVYESDYEYK
ncbi:MAG: ArsR family transcriptional regulator [Candidatus Lokiarchaeia archaeon]